MHQHDCTGKRTPGQDTVPNLFPQCVDGFRLLSNSTLITEYTDVTNSTTGSINSGTL